MAGGKHLDEVEQFAGIQEASTVSLGWYLPAEAPKHSS